MSPFFFLSSFKSLTFALPALLQIHCLLSSFIVFICVYINIYVCVCTCPVLITFLVVYDIRVEHLVLYNLVWEISTLPSPLYWLFIVLCVSLRLHWLFLSDRYVSCSLLASLFSSPLVIHTSEIFKKFGGEFYLWSYVKKWHSKLIKECKIPKMKGYLSI